MKNVCLISLHEKGNFFVYLSVAVCCYIGLKQINCDIHFEDIKTDAEVDATLKKLMESLIACYLRRKGYLWLEVFCTFFISLPKILRAHSSLSHEKKHIW